MPGSQMMKKGLEEDNGKIIDYKKQSAEFPAHEKINTAVAEKLYFLQRQYFIR